MKEMITLPDGRELTWDEFSALSEAEQSEAFKPQKKPIAQAERGAHFSNRELLPRIRAAAERNKLSEEDLLAFIKIMHDIFFPPVPILGTGTGVIEKKVQSKYGGAFMQQSKRVMTTAGEFPSLAAAGRSYQVDGSRIRAWIRDGKQGFYFITTENTNSPCSPH
jgi:hypothetical protein